MSEIQIFFLAQANVQNCFLVRPSDTEYADLYLKRSKVCLGIQFDYDASSANCETFCHYIHGNWDQGNVQSPRGGGQQLVSKYTKWSKLFKSLDQPLKHQMKSRIEEASLILPNETFWLKNVHIKDRKVKKLEIYKSWIE